MLKSMLNGKNFFSLIIAGLFLVLSVFAVNAETVPQASDDYLQESIGNSVSGSRYSGAFVINDEIKSDAQTYSSSKSQKNALLVTGGNSNITNSTIIKSGNFEEKTTDIYGTNSAVLVYNGATLNLSGGSVSTEGNSSDALFAYGTGVINVNDMTVSTIADNSGGLTVASGGTLSAKNATVSTTGNSSAAIKGGKGGGTLLIDGGTYSTSGVNSPAVYSNSKITVNNANLTSTASEGIVVEGANSVALKNVRLTDTNSKLYDNSKTYKNIFLYQSVPGNLKTGISDFTAYDSSIITNKGDTFFVTNTTATINLVNNTILNTSGDFLRIQADKWGDEEANGGNVTLNMSSQKIEGGIFVDDVSTLDMKMKDQSVFKGFIDSDNQSKKITLSLSKDSTFVLTSDSYVDLLKNEDSKNNSNIYLNGHKLYVNGNAVIGNESPFGEESTTVEVQTTLAAEETTQLSTESNQSERDDKNILYPITGIIAAAIVVIIIAAVIIAKKRNNTKINGKTTVYTDKNNK